MKNLESMTCAELRTFLEDKKMPTTGTKTELLLRAKMTISTEQPSSGLTPLMSDHHATDPLGVASGKTDDKAQLQPSTSTSLKSDPDVNDPADVASRKMDDFDLQHVTDAAGPLDDCAVHASAGNNFSGEKTTSQPINSGKTYVSTAIVHAEAFGEWMRLDQEQADIADEEFRLKQELEDREYQAKLDRLELERRRLEFERHHRRQMEDIEHNKRLEITQRRRDLKLRYDAHLQRCKELGLPFTDMQDSIEHLPSTAATLPPGKTVEFTICDASTADVDRAYQPSQRHVDSTDINAPVTVDNASVCSDVKHFMTPTSIAATTQRIVTSKTSTLPTSTAAPRSSTATPQPLVSSVPSQFEQFDVCDNTDRRIGNISPAAALTRTDTSATTQSVKNADVNRPALDSNASAFRPPRQPDQGDVLQQIIDNVSLPKPSFMTFDGDPLTYHVFMNSFDTSIHESSLPDATKLSHLMALCKGKANAAIRSSALMEPTAGYAHARRMLQDRFGDDFKISQAWVSKLVNGPTVKANHVDSLQNFTDDVRECVEILECLHLVHEIDTRCHLVSLMNRLPSDLIYRWRRQARTTRKAKGQYPSIKDFLDFLECATQEVTDPVFGLGNQTL